MAGAEVSSTSNGTVASISAVSNGTVSSDQFQQVTRNLQVNLYSKADNVVMWQNHRHTSLTETRRRGRRRCGRGVRWERLWHERDE